MGDNNNYFTHSPKLLAIIEIFLINIQHPFYYQNNTNTLKESLFLHSIIKLCDIERNQNMCASGTTVNKYAHSKDWKANQVIGLWE